MEENRDVIARIVKLTEQTKELFIEIHDLIIKETGGESGIRLDSTLYIMTYNLIQNIILKKATPLNSATDCLISIATRHPFTDGNKRSALVLSEIIYNIANFLDKKTVKEGKTLLLLKQPKYAEIEHEIILIAANKRTREDAKKLLIKLFGP